MPHMRMHTHTEGGKTEEEGKGGRGGRGEEGKGERKKGRKRKKEKGERDQNTQMICQSLSDFLSKTLLYRNCIRQFSRFLDLNRLLSEGKSCVSSDPPDLHFLVLLSYLKVNIMVLQQPLEASAILWQI